MSSGGVGARRGHRLDQNPEDSRSLGNVPDRDRKTLPGSEDAGELRGRLLGAAQMQ
jgi:hypothetical protein